MSHRSAPDAGRLRSEEILVRPTRLRAVRTPAGASPRRLQARRDHDGGEVRPLEPAVHFDGEAVEDRIDGREPIGDLEVTADSQPIVATGQEVVGDDVAWVLDFDTALAQACGRCGEGRD